MFGRVFSPATPRYCMIAASVALSLGAASQGLAGDDNLLFIEQTSVAGGSGNSLVVDQSLASGSVVAGDKMANTPARQSGPANTGRIELEGEGGAVLFQQQNTGLGAGTPNDAQLSGGAFATIALEQIGSGNLGRVDVGAGGNTGALFQYGTGNDGTVNVSGTGSTGTLYQKGDNNEAGLDVDGVNLTVQWNQVGNNIAPVSQATPAQVISNAGTVIINQTSY